jgi:transforming growth factor-beta-induced protein
MPKLLIRRSLAGVAVVAVLALVAAGCGGDDDDSATASGSGSSGSTTTTAASEGSSSSQASGDILEVAQAQGDLGTFLSATDAAGIMGGLHGKGPFTVFIPTDKAFETYLTHAGMTQEQLFANPGELKSLVQYHIVDMDEMSEQLMGMNGQSFTTESGEPLNVTVSGDTVKVGDATIQRHDIEATNGTIHVVDQVLIPPSMQGQ